MNKGSLLVTARHAQPLVLHAVRIVFARTLDTLFFHTAECTSVSWVGGGGWQHDGRCERGRLHHGEGELDREQTGGRRQARGGENSNLDATVLVACTVQYCGDIVSGELRHVLADCMV